MNLFIQNDIHDKIKRSAIANDEKIGRLAERLLLQEMARGVSETERSYLKCHRVGRESHTAFSVDRSTIRQLRMLAIDLETTLSTLVDLLFRRAVHAGSNAQNQRVLAGATAAAAPGGV